MLKPTTISRLTSPRTDRSSLFAMLLDEAAENLRDAGSRLTEAAANAPDLLTQFRLSSKKIHIDSAMREIASAREECDGAAPSANDEDGDILDA